MQPEQLPKIEPVVIPKPLEVKQEEKPKEMSEVEKMKANLKRWQKEQDKLEKVNKELGKINVNLTMMREPSKEQKAMEEIEEIKEEVKTLSRIIHICVPCRRKFNSLEGLQNHLDKSELHMVLYTLET